MGPCGVNMQGWTRRQPILVCRRFIPYQVGLVGMYDGFLSQAFSAVFIPSIYGDGKPPLAIQQARLLSPGHTQNGFLEARTYTIGADTQCRRERLG